MNIGASLEIPSQTIARDNHPRWRHAMNVDMLALQANDTSDLVSHAHDQTMV